LEEPKIHFCYLDTNSLLHYKYFLDIDWCKALKLKKITLIICRPVLNELDKKKYNHPNKKIRERARKITIKINSFLSEGLHATLRKNVEVELLDKKLKVDWEKEGLDQSNLDDQIIAFILDDKRKNKKLISSDAGFQLKTKCLRIDSIALPDSYRQELKDERDKLIKELRKPLEPALKVGTIQNYKYVNKAKFKLYDPPQFLENNIEKEIEKIKNEIRNKFQGKDVSFNHIWQILVNNTENMRTLFQLKYRYIIDMFKIRGIIIYIENDGNCPAEEIDVNLYFPDKLKILNKNELPHEPSEPSILEKIPGISELINNSFQRLLKYEKKGIGKSSFLAELFENTREMNWYHDEGLLEWTKRRNKVTFNFEKLRHLYHLKLGIYIQFPEKIKEKYFPIDYGVSAINLPKLIEGTVNIEIKTMNQVPPTKKQK